MKIEIIFRDNLVFFDDIISELQGQRTSTRSDSKESTSRRNVTLHGEEDPMLYITLCEIRTFNQPVV